MKNRIKDAASSPSDDINFSETIIKELYRKQFNSIRKLCLTKESEVNQ